MAGIEITTAGDAIAASERFAAGVPNAIYRSVLAGALLLGRKVAENIEAFKETVGTRRMSRSFLVPEPHGREGFMLGAHSPIYTRIHEYGGDIVPVHADYLVFETPDGIWHSVKKVTIKEKRFARDAIEEFETSGEMESILAAELTAEFSA